MLARREHSEKEIVQKLRKKHFPENEIQQVLHDLVKENALSNQRFIENYIHYRQQKGFGPLRIQLELQEKGLSEDLIEQHLDIADNVWLTQAYRVWEKKFKGPVTPDFKKRAQQIRFLQHRGFTIDQIKKVISNDELNYAD